MSTTTVLGPVSASQLGITLTHEHFALDFHNFYSPPPDQIGQFFKQDFTLRNIGYVQRYPYGHKTNVRFYGSDCASAVVQDVKQFQECGGGTIVENTTHGIQRDLPLMIKVAQETGINVIAGTGHYVACTQNPEVLNSSVETLCNIMTKELTEGCDGSETKGKPVKCGFIGEVGSAWPLHEFEVRAIKATGEVQEQLGCPVSFHPGRDPAAPTEIIRVFLEAGGKVGNTVMSHLDRTLVTDEQLLEFAELGTYCQFDLFGVECSWYQLKPDFDMISDAQRIDQIRTLIDDDKEDRILVSHDIHTRHRLVWASFPVFDIQFGGHGYAHLLLNVRPKMVIKGLSESTIENIFVHNPAAWLTSK